MDWSARKKIRGTIPDDSRQLRLFPHVAEAYARGPKEGLSNAALYDAVGQAAGLSGSDLKARVPIGKAGAMRSPVEREIRWHQQTLRQLGVLERVEGERGVWRLAESAGKGLHRVIQGVKLVAFSTNLGIAIWARNTDLDFPKLDEPIALCLTSPPYPLRFARAYGGVAGDTAYVDFVCSSLEGIVRQLQPGGAIVLNISNDIFAARSPARSLYVERLVLAMCDRLGLHLMDRMPWVNFSKPPGPTYWACVNRVQLCSAYEHVIWFTNDPSRVRSDNRRVLEAHTARHRQLMEAGGEGRTCSYGDGAYRLREHSFGAVTPGRIPRNVVLRGHACADTTAYRQACQREGLPAHGAMMPTSLADFFIRFLTEAEDLVVDPFGGTARTGLAAERLGRRWLVAEWIREYLLGASCLFKTYPGFSMNSSFAAL